MRLLQILVVTVVFLLCLLFGAVGGGVIGSICFSPRVSSGAIDVFEVSMLGMFLPLFVGTVLGVLLGGASAVYVWGLLSRQMSEEP